MTDKRCVIVIPAYNEAETIEQVVRRSLAYADVCVVDDSSTDATAGIVSSIDGVHLIRHSVNTHIAKAVLDGMRYAAEAGYARCVTMDAGLSHDPGELPRLLAVEDADLVIGTRVQHRGTPFYRRSLSATGNALINLGLRKGRGFDGPRRLADATSGYRVYSRKAFELLINSPLQSRAFDFHLESLFLVARAGMRIGEAPVTYSFSNSSLRWRIVLEALSTWCRLWRG